MKQYKIKVSYIAQLSVCAPNGQKWGSLDDVRNLVEETFKPHFQRMELRFLTHNSISEAKADLLYEVRFCVSPISAENQDDAIEQAKRITECLDLSSRNVKMLEMEYDETLWVEIVK